MLHMLVQFEPDLLLRFKLHLNSYNCRTVEYNQNNWHFSLQDEHSLLNIIQIQQY